MLSIWNMDYTCLVSFTPDWNLAEENEANTHQLIAIPMHMLPKIIMGASMGKYIVMLAEFDQNFARKFQPPIPPKFHR